MQRVGQMAGMLVNLPPEARAQAYRGIVQQLHSIGLGDGLPDQWVDSLLPYAQQLAGIGGGSNGVQSTYIDAQGNRVAIMRDGSTQVLGQNAPQNQIIDTGNGFYGVNKGNLQAAPVMVGGSQGGAVPYTIDPSLPPEVQAAIRSDPNAGSPQGIQSLPQQLQKAPAAITPYQGAELAMQQERLRASQAAAASAAAAADSARTLKEQAAAAKQQKVQAAQADTIATYDDSIRKIDELLKSPDVGTLGTYTGDAMAIFPHSGARNARAALDTIKNRVLLDTISKLKALSATGASGFGALSNQEGEILKNSIASLDKAQTHDAIVAALKDIQRVMRTSRDRVAGAGQQAAPAANSANDPLGIL
jgi:hypothetical protein